MRVYRIAYAFLLTPGALAALALLSSLAGKTGLAIASSAATALTLIFTVLFMLTRILRPLKKLWRLCPAPSGGRSSRGEVEACIESLSSTVGRNLETYNRLLKNLPCVAIEVDPSLNVTSINEEARKLTGLGPEVIGRPLSALVPEGHWEILRPLLEEALEAAYASKANAGIVFKSGEATVFELNLIPAQIEGERRLVIAAADRSDAERTREELKKARMEAEENSARLKKTISELEEFALMAVRREMKMREIRERLSELKADTDYGRKHPN